MDTAAQHVELLSRSRLRIPRPLRLAAVWTLVLVAALLLVPYAAMSLSGLRRDIQIGSPAPDVISVTARGDTAGDAGATASAVARSYLRYVGSASSPAGRVPAHLLGPATSVTGTARLLLLLAGAGLGAVSGVLTGVIAAVVSRRLTS